MYKCEEVFSEIVAIRVTTRCTLSEAVVAYAEAADCDVEEVIKALDSTAVAQIRESLLNSIALKPSMRRIAPPQISFE